MLLGSLLLLREQSYLPLSSSPPHSYITVSIQMPKGMMSCREGFIITFFRPELRSLSNLALSPKLKSYLPGQLTTDIDQRSVEGEKEKEQKVFVHPLAWQSRENKMLRLSCLSIFNASTSNFHLDILSARCSEGKQCFFFNPAAFDSIWSWILRKHIALHDSAATCSTSTSNFICPWGAIGFAARHCILLWSHHQIYVAELFAFKYFSSVTQYP